MQRNLLIISFLHCSSTSQNKALMHLQFSATFTCTPKGMLDVTFWWRQILYHCAGLTLWISLVDPCLGIRAHSAVFPSGLLGPHDKPWSSVVLWGVLKWHLLGLLFKASPHLLPSEIPLVWKFKRRLLEWLLAAGWWSRKWARNDGKFYQSTWRCIFCGSKDKNDSNQMWFKQPHKWW